ncbi:MAG: hypothetical protein EXR58_05955 [Chloroflexi bacterium]|nr:hypothetical protein [Chloroflexota bacterium]
MSTDQSLLNVLQVVGRDMYLTGLVSSHSGTLSILVDGSLSITRRNAMLGRLTTDDLIDLSLDGESPEAAPEDALIHRAIYRATLAKAVIHARPTATMALALIEDRLAPANGEGADSFGVVSVAISQRPFGSTEVADLMGQMLKESRVAVLRGRGVFAWGDDLDAALHMVSLLEEMCRVAYLFRTLSRDDEQPAMPDRSDRQPSNLSPYRTPRDGGNRPPVRHGGNARRPPPPAGPRRDGPPPRRQGGGGGGSPGTFRP